MTASKFDISSSFRAEPPLPASNAPARGDRAGDNAFADILRAQNTERDIPAAEMRDDGAPRDEMPPSSTDKPAPRQATKEKDAPAQPRQNDSAQNDASSTASDTSVTANDAAAPDEQAKPKAAHDETGNNGRDNAPAKDAATAPVENKSTDITALDAAAAAAVVAVPIVPAPVVIVAAAVTAESSTATPAGKTAAPVAPIPAPAPDAAMPAGDKPAAKSEMPQGEVASANASPVAPDTADNDAAANFDQLVAAALRAAPPREPRKSNASDVSVVATPGKPATSAATPVPTTPQAPAANAPAVPAPAATPTAAPAATAPIAPSTNVDGAPAATDEEAEAASLAALVKRPAAPRNAEPRQSASTQITVSAVPEPRLSDAEPIEAPAPRSGAGALTAATGLAAQVKGQELQNTPQQTVDMRVAANPEKAAAESAVSASATPDADSSVGRETPNTPSTARTSEGQALPPAHDSAVRGTSFTDALNAARGPRASANPLVAQVVVQVTKAVSEGNDRITIKLSPADLGRIDVRLDIGSDGKIQAVFAADKPQTVEMLQRDARELERALQDAGLRADSGSLSFNLRGEQRDANGSAFAGGTSRTGDADALAEAPVAAAQIYAGTNAANGRLDIHV